MALQAMQQATAGTRFLDPAVLARIGNLELVARTVVEGFLGGLHRSPHFGASTDFAEHRPYVPGDDVRRVDWRLWARSDRYSVKEFEADTNTNTTVLLDVSRSMGFQGPGSPMSKLDYGKRLAACLAYFSSKQRDRVGMATIRDDIVTHLRPSAKQLPAILHTLEQAEAAGEGRLEPPLKLLAERFRRRSIIILISDLYEDPEAVLQAIGHIRGKGNDLIVFQVLDHAEIDFPYEDASGFEDLETGAVIPVVPSKLRDRYKTLMDEHIRALGQQLAGARVDYALFDTSKPLDHALHTYLLARQRLGRVR